MNVMQAAPPRGRNFRGCARGRVVIPNAQRVTNIFPKYQFNSAFRRSSTSSGPARSAANTTTPRRNRRESYISTSSCLLSTTRRSTGSINPSNSELCTSSVTDSPVMIALTAGRGDAKNEVGLAAIDLQYPYLILCQISDCQTYVNTLTKINVFDPIEILMPETMCERRGCGDKLYKLIKEKFTSLNVTPILRTHFNESIGMERVRTLCAREYSTVELIVKQKYYALAAAAALLKYVEYVQHMVYVPKSMRIEYQGSPNTTIIDLESARSLELIVSQSKHSIVSLLGTMDRCLTPMGRRLLRASILQPPCDERLIVDRQFCVAELVANRSLCSSLQPVVQRLFGADRLLTLATKPLYINDIQNAERNLNYVLLLKSCLDTVPELQAILAIGTHAFFVKIHKNSENSEFRVMKDKILTLIHADARFVKGSTSSCTQRCFAIKAGINELLDVARQIYCELISDMRNLVEQLAVKYKLPLSLEYNVNLGYHIHIVVPRNLDYIISDLPAEFIRVRKNRKSLTMTTTALLTLDKQCRKACEEIYTMSNTLLINLLEDIRQHVGCLYQLSVDVAELDLILSLAQISCNPEYVRPTFGAELELKNSLHPIMELFNTDLPVPNDVNASAAHNFHLITGPNMSGKSTYVKQIVLLQIMAQIGSYVPATKATFRIANRILCRICSRNEADLNASAYVLEMKETQYILQSVTPNSLVVLDELCRHTTVEEGLSVAWSIYERLLLTAAFTFAATHFQHLTALSDMYRNVTTHYFETISAESDGTNELHLIYTHKLNLGMSPSVHYGIALAEVSSLPKDVTVKAREYASQQSTGTQSDAVSRVRNTPSWEKLCYDAVVQLGALSENNQLNLSSIMSIMKQLDLDKQRKASALPKQPAMTTRFLAKSANVESRKTTQEKEKREECCEKSRLAVSGPRGNSTFVDSAMELTNTLLTELTERARKDHPESLKDGRERREQPRTGGGDLTNLTNDKFPSTVNNKQADLSNGKTTVNRAMYLLLNDAADELLSVSPSVSSTRQRLADFEQTSKLTSNVTQSNLLERSMHHESIIDDPLFYVCTSFTTTSSQKTTVVSPRQASLESSFDSRLMPSSPATSFRSSQSFQYHDYCLSDREFDITLPSDFQTTPSAIARMISKEMEIEDCTFDERIPFDNTQMPMRIDLTNDDEAMASSM